MIHLHAFPDRSTPVALDAQLLALARAPHLRRARVAELVCLCPQTLLAWSQCRGLALSAAAVTDDVRDAPTWALRMAIRAVVSATVMVPRSDTGNWLSTLHGAATVKALAHYLNLDDPDGLGGRALVAGSVRQQAWDDDVLLSDMIEFAGESPDLLADAHPGVILVAAARALEADAMDTAESLAALVHVPARRLAMAHADAGAALRARCEAAGLLDCNVSSAMRDLTTDLACVARVDALALQLAHLDRMDVLRGQAARTLGQWFAGRAAEFHPDGSAGEVYLAGTTRSVTGIRVRPGGGRNLLAECVRQGRVLRSGAEPQPLTVVDRQLLRRLDSPDALYVPLMAEGEPMGAIVLAMKPDGACADAALVQWFAVMYAEWLHVRCREDERVRKIEADYLAANERRLREVVHEANNPLSIVHNYLHILGLRLNDEDAGREQLEMIGEEIRRTGEILQGLLKVPLQLDGNAGSAPQAVCPAGQLDAAVRSVAALLQPVLAARGVELNVVVAANMPPVAVPDERLRQLVTNLLRSAADVLVTGGQIEVSASADVIRDGVPNAELHIVTSAGSAPDGETAQPEGAGAGAGGPGGPGFDVVQRLVSALGGSIESRMPANARGSVTVLLPLAG